MGHAHPMAIMKGKALGLCLRGKIETMNKTLIWVMAASMGILSCAEKTGNQEQGTENKENTRKESPISTEADLPTKATDIDLARYATSTSTIGTFGHLLGKSTWFEKLKDQKITFFCPTDESLKNYNISVISQLKLPENKGVLDKIIGSHLVKEDLNLATIYRMKELVAADGSKLVVDSASQTINGIAFSGQEVITKGGTIVVIRGIINHDEDAVKASVKEHMKKK